MRSRDGFLRSFRRSQRGSVAVIATLSFVTMAGVAGAALDYSQASMAYTDWQTAMDSAVLAGISGYKEDADAIAAAEKYFTQNRQTPGTLQNLQFQYVDGKLEGTATVRVATEFLKLIHVDYIDVTAHSIATAATLRVPMCVMAMHPTRKHTLELTDAVSVNAPDCNIYGNSNHPWDVVDPHSTETFLTGKSVQAVGYGHHYLENVTPPLEYAPEVIADPLASRTIPAAGTCLETGLVIKGGVNTLDPGTYCNGLQILEGAKVTLNPGTYIIAGNTFKTSKSWITGDGVTIVLADSSVDLDWQDSEIRLSAPKTGTYKSMVMMAARVDNTGSFVDSTIDLHGMVYMPNMAIDWENTGTPTITAKWTVWLVDGFSWTGDGTINIPFKPEDSDIPFIKELYVIPHAGTPRLVS